MLRSIDFSILNLSLNSIYYCDRQKNYTALIEYSVLYIEQIEPSYIIRKVKDLIVSLSSWSHSLNGVI
jgi:hypothetical protein